MAPKAARQMKTSAAASKRTTRAAASRKKTAKTPKSTKVKSSSSAAPSAEPSPSMAPDATTTDHTGPDTRSRTRSRSNSITSTIAPPLGSSTSRVGEGAHVAAKKRASQEPEGPLDAELPPKKKQRKLSTPATPRAPRRKGKKAAISKPLQTLTSIREEDSPINAQEPQPDHGYHSATGSPAAAAAAADEFEAFPDLDPIPSVEQEEAGLSLPTGSPETVQALAAVHASVDYEPFIGSELLLGSDSEADSEADSQAAPANLPFSRLPAPVAGNTKPRLRFSRLAPYVSQPPHGGPPAVASLSPEVEEDERNVHVAYGTHASYAEDVKEFLENKADPYIVGVYDSLVAEAAKDGKPVMVIPPLIDLSSTDDEDGPYCWSGRDFTQLYLIAYHKQNWDICDLVIDNWIRAFQPRRRLWRENKHPVKHFNHAGKRVYPPANDNEPPEAEVHRHISVAQFDPELVSLLYNCTEASAGARLLFADAIALCGAGVERKLDLDKKQWPDDLRWEVMKTALRMVRARVTLRCEERHPELWCERYHEHARHGIRCYREAHDALAYGPIENSEPEVVVEDPVESSDSEEEEQGSASAATESESEGKETEEVESEEE